MRFGRVGAVVDPARDVLKLRQVTVRPPHFVLVVRGQAKPVAQGQNNLFAAIVLLVHTVATNHLGRLLYAPRLTLRRGPRSRRRTDEEGITGLVRAAAVTRTLPRRRCG